MAKKLQNLTKIAKIAKMLKNYTSKRKIILTELLPFIAATPELGEELFGLATIVLNAALIGVDEACVANAGGTPGFEPGSPLPVWAGGGVATSWGCAPPGPCTGGTEATGDGGTLLTEFNGRALPWALPCPWPF